jgi:hypothetical protein
MAFGLTTTAFTPWWLARTKADGKAPVGFSLIHQRLPHTAR